MEYQNLTLDKLLGPLNHVEGKNAPTEIYALVDISLFKKHMSVSIIGTRKPTYLGIKRAQSLARAVVSRGGIVVSGLAEGIDTAVHTATIEMGGKTVAVIGTPLDQVYPRKNSELQEHIAREHLLISQFPNTSKITPKNFIRRNKTMALVSDATVIVEAGEKSGTIHQGWEAIRLGRPLFLMKSLANNQDLSWPKELIKYGAEVLTKELLDEFFEMLPVAGREGDESIDLF